jgi:hypothetical protein
MAQKNSRGPFGSKLVKFSHTLWAYLHLTACSLNLGLSFFEFAVRASCLWTNDKYALRLPSAACGKGVFWYFRSTSEHLNNGEFRVYAQNMWV